MGEGTSKTRREAQGYSWKAPMWPHLWVVSGSLTHYRERGSGGQALEQEALDHWPPCQALTQGGAWCREFWEVSRTGTCKLPMKVVLSLCNLSTGMEIGGQSSRKSQAESITSPVCMWLKSPTGEYLVQLYLGDLPPFFPHSLYAGSQADPRPCPPKE